jgi:TolB protein
VLPRFAYSPDGRALVYARLGPAGYGDSDLWVLDVATGQSRRLTSMRGAEEAPRFVDADTIELVGTARGLQSRFRIPLSGGTPVQVTNLGLAKTGPGLPAGYVSPWAEP